MLYSASIQSSEARHIDPRFAVWISAINLTGFRNYDQLSLRFDGQPVVLVGANGAGKTNLMEAVSLLAPGRGLRRANTTQLQRRSPVSPPPQAGASQHGLKRLTGLSGRHRHSRRRYQ